MESDPFFLLVFQLSLLVFIFSAPTPIPAYYRSVVVANSSRSTDDRGYLFKMKYRRRNIACGTCGKTFTSVPHMITHQSRSCVAPDRTESVTGRDLSVPKPSPGDFDLLADNNVNLSLDDDASYTPLCTTVPILEQLDLQKRVADDISTFHSCLTQCSEQIVSSSTNIMEHINVCPAHYRPFLHSCTSKSLTKSAIDAMYKLIVAFEE